MGVARRLVSLRLWLAVPVGLGVAWLLVSLRLWLGVSMRLAVALVPAVAVVRRRALRRRCWAGVRGSRRQPGAAR